MSAQLSLDGTPPRFTINAASRAVLRTRPRIQRVLIRSWDYIPAVRVAILTVRMLAVMVLVITTIALFSIPSWWALVTLAGALAVLPLGLWIFTTAAKGWPAR
jgi:hypothetical protein